jgi:hypothetical protein
MSLSNMRAEINQSGNPIPLQRAELRSAAGIIRIFQPGPRSINHPNLTRLIILWKSLDRFFVERRFVLHT